jgi:hypothetical protein
MSRAQPYEEVLQERNRLAAELQAHHDRAFWAQAYIDRAFWALLEVKDRDLCSRPGDLPGGEVAYSGEVVLAAQILDVDAAVLVQQVRARRAANRRAKR